jgi:hypothetical protein
MPHAVANRHYFFLRITIGVIALVFLLLMKTPYFVKIPLGVQGTNTQERQDRLCSQQTPTACDVHTHLDQIAAGTLDHTRRDGESLGQIVVIAQIPAVIV